VEIAGFFPAARAVKMAMKRHKAQKANKKKGAQKPVSLPLQFGQLDPTLVREISSPEPPVANMEQPRGTLTYDNGLFVYEGFALDLEKAGTGYIPIAHLLSAEEAGVIVEQDESNLESLLDRVCAMLDLVGRDRQRQMEIRRFGARTWHSPYRPEYLTSQALDFAFYHHHVHRIARLLRLVDSFFQEAEVDEVDAWTRELQRAYRLYRGSDHDATALMRVLAKRGIPAQVVFVCFI
jgi:hypothetical protein